MMCVQSWCTTRAPVCMTGAGVNAPRGGFAEWKGMVESLAWLGQSAAGHRGCVSGILFAERPEAGLGREM